MTSAARHSPPRRNSPRPPPQRQFSLSTTKRRRFERLFLLNRAFNSLITACGKFVLTAMIWPRFVAPYRWKLTRHPMPLANLHPVFHGYKILHLTDLHVGRTKASYLAKVFARCLQEKPDLIVITGDLIDYEPESLPILKKLLEPLVVAGPRDGIVAIFGNHDYHEYSWRHTGPRSAHRSIHKRLVGLLQSLGIHLLRNEHYRITRNVTPASRRPPADSSSASFTIVGLDEMWTHLADPAAAFADLKPDEPILCLQHNPDGIAFLKPYPWQYMLCGHSHGGQANLPFLGPLYVPMEFPQYLRGHYHFAPVTNQPLERRTMFVSTGLGHSTPMRLFCPPEATVFTLSLAESPFSFDDCGWGSPLARAV